MAESFEQTLQTLSLEELQEEKRVLSNQLTKALKTEKPTEELEQKLLLVKNRITALKIRC